MEPEDSLAYSQVPATCPYLEPDQSNRQHYMKGKHTTNGVRIFLFCTDSESNLCLKFSTSFYFFGESKSDLFSFPNLFWIFPAFCVLNLNERLVPSLCTFISRLYRAPNRASVSLVLPLFISCSSHFSDHRHEPQVNFSHLRRSCHLPNQVSKNTLAVYKDKTSCPCHKSV